MKKRSNRKRSQKQEKRIGKELSGKLQPGSGSTAAYKGDIISALGDRYFIEAKLTNARQVTLKLDTIEKMERDAQGTRNTPIMIVTFEQAHRDFVIIAKEDFQLLAERGN